MGLGLGWGEVEWVWVGINGRLGSKQRLPHLRTGARIPDMWQVEWVRIHYAVERIATLNFERLRAHAWKRASKSRVNSRGAWCAQ